MLLAHAGVKFEEENITFEQWPARKAEFPAGQLPIWVDEQGRHLNQSIAILNMLAREHGYSPKSSYAEWANAWVSETIADFMSKGYTKHMFAPEVSEEVVKTWTADTVSFNSHFEKHLA